MLASEQLQEWDEMLRGAQASTQSDIVLTRIVFIRQGIRAELALRGDRLPGGKIAAAALARAQEYATGCVSCRNLSNRLNNTILAYNGLQENLEEQTEAMDLLKTRLLKMSGDRVDVGEYDRMRKVLDETQAKLDCQIVDGAEAYNRGYDAGVKDSSY